MADHIRVEGKTQDITRFAQPPAVIAIIRTCRKTLIQKPDSAHGPPFENDAEKCQHVFNQNSGSVKMKIKDSVALVKIICQEIWNLRNNPFADSVDALPVGGA